MGRHRRLGGLAMLGAVVVAGCGGAGHGSVAAGSTTTSSSRVATTTTTTTTTIAPVTSTAAPSTTVVRPATKAVLTPTVTSVKVVVIPPTTSGCGAPLAGQLAATGGGSQLITVEAASTGSTSGTVTLWQRSGSCWSVAAGPWTGDLGYHGVSADKHEGDGTTPIGLFAISSAFYGNAANPGVHGSYHLLVCGDWWDEDPDSPTYNTFQHVACGTTPAFAMGSEGSGSEALWTETSAYQSFAVIDYNTYPGVAGKGSAIFIHDNVGGPTNGCVSLPPSDLDTMLRWLEPGESPHIAIGTESDIREY
jgi:L,D-peptidoglycan transpeptidase YkuD (ErfK/YbiS/YcfS/YnhG family)